MRRVRRGLSWGLVAAVGVSGIAGLEAWPLTGWRLFSVRRQPVATRYEARAVATDGAEAPVPFATLPHAYSGFVPVLRRMASEPPAAREPACSAWAAATARATATTVAEVRVYEVTVDHRNGTSRSALAWTCGRQGTR